MYLPPGKWRLISPQGVGELVIMFWTPPGEPFPIRGTLNGNPIGGIWSTVTGDISFITNTGLAFSGTLNFYRLNYPVAGVYVMSGTVNGPTGSAQWLADTFVVP